MDARIHTSVSSGRAGAAFGYQLRLSRRGNPRDLMLEDDASIRSFFSGLGDPTLEDGGHYSYVEMDPRNPTWKSRRSPSGLRRRRRN